MIKTTLTAINSFTYSTDKSKIFVYFLIFLFPIAGMSVKHWISNIYILLILLALYSLRKKSSPLLKQEKYFLWICAIYFTTFIFTSLVNGWGKAQTYYLGTELRFLIAIPLYLLLRRYSNCDTWLIRGAILGSIFMFSQAFYDVYILNHNSAIGIYSKNIIGPYAVLTGIWSFIYILYNYKTLKHNQIYFIIFSILAAMFTLALSGSRGGFVGFFLTSILCVILFSKYRWIIPSLITICLIAFLFYKNLNTVQLSVDAAINKTKLYFQTEDHVKDIYLKNSTGIRLEMIRTSILLIKEKPLVGIGPGNYEKAIEHYIQVGKANPAIGNFAFPHNSFLEVVIGKGLIGLLSLLLLFYYPAYIYIKTYKLSKSTASIGLVNITAFTAFSFTDHSVILMNNYTSILLLSMTIFFSAHINKVSSIRKN